MESIEAPEKKGSTGGRRYTEAEVAAMDSKAPRFDLRGALTQAQLIEIEQRLRDVIVELWEAREELEMRNEREPERYPWKPIFHKIEAFERDILGLIEIARRSTRP